MTQDEIIKLANDAELCQTIWIDDSDDDMVRTVIAFAKLVAAKEREKLKNVAIFDRWYQELDAAVLAEREACAKVCEEEGKLWSKAGCTDTQTFGLCATTIRARGEA